MYKLSKKLLSYTLMYVVNKWKVLHKNTSNHCFYGSQREVNSQLKI